MHFTSLSGLFAIPEQVFEFASDYKEEVLTSFLRVEQVALVVLATYKVIRGLQAKESWKPDNVIKTMFCFGIAFAAAGDLAQKLYTGTS